MTQSQVIKRFLEGREGNAGNVRSIRCSSPGSPLVMFSYDEPIALHEGGKVRICEHNYSMTTNRHVRNLELALRIGSVHLGGAWGNREQVPRLPHDTVCRATIRRMLNLPPTPPRVERRGRQTYRDGVRVMMGEGGPTPMVG